MPHTHTFLNEFCRCAAPDSPATVLSSPTPPARSIWPHQPARLFQFFHFNLLFCYSCGLHMPPCSFPPTHFPLSTPLLFFGSHFISTPLLDPFSPPHLICQSATEPKLSKPKKNLFSSLSFLLSLSLSILHVLLQGIRHGIINLTNTKQTAGVARWTGRGQQKRAIVCVRACVTSDKY